MDLFGPALGALKARNLLILWLRGLDLNQRPLGYEPNELPGCSTPLLNTNKRVNSRQTSAATGQRLPEDQRYIQIKRSPVQLISHWLIAEFVEAETAVLATAHSNL